MAAFVEGKVMHAKLEHCQQGSDERETKQQKHGAMEKRTCCLPNWAAATKQPGKKPRKQEKSRVAHLLLAKLGGGYKAGQVLREGCADVADARRRRLQLVLHAVVVVEQGAAVGVQLE